nr:hypothetical protein [Tanacetum cinerariifolium]
MLRLLPEVARSKVALRRVTELSERLSEEDIAPAAATRLEWDTIRFDQVCYQHQSGDGAGGDAEGFRVGPIDLEFAKGEIT